jgi:hypothetical protein
MAEFLFQEFHLQGLSSRGNIPLVGRNALKRSERVYFPAGRSSADSFHQLVAASPAKSLPRPITRDRLGPFGPTIPKID